jgi:hypothetical protein
MSVWARPRWTRWFVVVLSLVASALAHATSQPSPDLSGVLRRAGEVVERYTQTAAVILADEECQQRAYRNGAWLAGRGAGDTVVDTIGRRRWKAELALVLIPELSQSGYPWMEIRDVVEADGRPLPDRKARLERMLRTEPEWRTTRAREILAESARFNIGPVRRTTNTPAVPLLILHPPNQARFAFSKIGEERIERIAAWKIAFRETRRPTLIRAGDDGSDMAAAGTLWVDPSTGEVLRSELQCGASENRLTVVYRRHPAFGLRLPLEMQERAAAVKDRSWVEGKCSYSNFRRFETGARVIIPKQRDGMPR